MTDSKATDISWVHLY